jgi:branched-chain amino acid transport system ATP-binding protein
VRLFAVVACALFAFVFMGAEKPKGEPIRAKIGVISIITGQGAAYGEAITNGIKLARDEVNAKGEVLIDLNVEDSSGKQEQALAAAQKLINSEKVVAIIGANGAGKTTLMKTITGVLRPRCGTVSFLGEEITGLPSHEIVRRGVALIPEGRAILSRMTVRENLEMGAFTRRDAKKILADMDRVMERFPVLRERAGQLGGSLSGGEQQMLAIARALMSAPKLLLLDEPTLGLAPLVVADIFSIIREINAAGTTILLVEQNVRQALKVSGYTYVLETGKIALSGPSTELLQEPRIKASYLGQ